MVTHDHGTALDVSGVAIERAARHAEQAGVPVRWVHAALLEASDLGTFDLVSAQYPALRSTADHAAERALMAAVAPAGRLLFVHHVMDAASAAEHGFRLEEWVRPEDMVAQLGEGWTVEVDDVRPREVSTGAGAHHREDVVLMARRPA